VVDRPSIYNYLMLNGEMKEIKELQLANLYCVICDVGVVGAVHWWSLAGNVTYGGTRCRKWLVMGGGERLRGERERRVKSEE
jgi:hypothetical protein